MKKRLITMLIALSVVMVGCSSAKTTDSATNTDKMITENTAQKSTEAQTEESVQIEDTGNVVETDTVIQVLAETAETAVDETVWVNTLLNVRSGPGTNYSVLGTLSYGTAVRRVAILDNGWSRIEYNSSTAYVSSKYVQTTEVATAQTTTSSTADTTELCTGVAKELFDLTNQARANAGLPALKWSDELARCADVRANEIVTNFSHVRPDGTKCYSLSNKIAGENILRGPSATAQEMFDHWMASEGHKENILYSGYGSIGISAKAVEKGVTACQLFGY
jgi:uncharacterized protein YkwD/uncharacterized protein YceK